MGRSKKDPFADLPEEFTDAVQGMSKAELDARICELAKAEEANQAAKAADQQLKEAKEAAKEAGAQYKEATKGNKARIQFCMRVLNDRGQE